MSARPPHDSGRVLGHVAEWEAHAVDYVAGTLLAKDREAIDLHLATCPTCAEAIADQQTIAALIRETPLAAPPASLESRVLATLTASSAPTPALETAVPLGERPAEAAAPRRGARRVRAGWWDRVTSLLDRPVARKLTPALAATLILVVSLVGLAQLSPGELTSGGEGATTTAAAEQTVTTMASASTEVAGDAEGGAATRTEEGMTDSTASSGETVASVPGAATTDTLHDEPSVGGPVSTTSLLTQTTAAGSQDVETFVSPPPEAQVVYVTVTAGETTAGAEDLVRWSTGLAPLPSELWLGAPTYAAFMPADAIDAMALDLAAQGVRVSVSNEPPQGMMEQVEAIAGATLPTIAGPADDGDAGSRPAEGPSETTPVKGGLLLVVVIAR